MPNDSCSAARRAGADQADALAVRAVSLSVEVRDGAVEESERSEGDDLGLRVIVGRKQAVVSTNDLKSDGFDALAERAVAMARAAPEDRFAGLADQRCIGAPTAGARPLDPDMPGVDVLEARAREAEAAGLAVAGVTKSGGASASAGIGGMVLVTSHGFRGATLASRHGIAMTAIAGDGTAMERDYDYSSTLHASDLENAHTIGRRAGERAVKRLNPRKVATRRVPVVFDSRISGSLVGHLASAANGALDRAQDEFPAGQARRKDFCLRHRHRRRSAAAARAALAAVRRRRHRRPPAPAGRGRRAQDLDPRLRDRARTRSGKRPVMRSAAFPRRRLRRPSNLHLAAGTKTPDQLIGDIEDGFFITDMIGMGVNLVTGDYSRGASGFWIENGERTYRGQRSHDRRPSLGNLRKPCAGERPGVPLRHQRTDVAQSRA